MQESTISYRKIAKNEKSRVVLLPGGFFLGTHKGVPLLLIIFVWFVRI